MVKKQEREKKVRGNRRRTTHRKGRGCAGAAGERVCVYCQGIHGVDGVDGVIFSYV